MSCQFGKYALLYILRNEGFVIMDTEPLTGTMLREIYDRKGKSGVEEKLSEYAENPDLFDQVVGLMIPEPSQGLLFEGDPRLESIERMARKRPREAVDGNMAERGNAVRMLIRQGLLTRIADRVEANVLGRSSRPNSQQTGDSRFYGPGGYRYNDGAMATSLNDAFDQMMSEGSSLKDTFDQMMSEGPSLKDAFDQMFKEPEQKKVRMLPEGYAVVEGDPMRNEKVEYNGLSKKLNNSDSTMDAARGDLNTIEERYVWMARRRELFRKISEYEKDSGPER